MIEVDKTYLIKIKHDCELFEIIEHNLLNKNEYFGGKLPAEITHIHTFGFLFKSNIVKNDVELNLMWDVLEWIISED